MIKGVPDKSSSSSSEEESEDEEHDSYTREVKELIDCFEASLEDKLSC